MHGASKWTIRSLSPDEGYIAFSITMRTIQIAGDEGMHDYGVLLANDEGKWLFSQLNDEGKEIIFSEGFNGPLEALRILSEQGWDVVKAYLPRSELHDLIVELRSLTLGVGSFAHKFDHMQELTGRDAEKVITSHRQEAAQ